MYGPNVKKACGSRWRNRSPGALWAGASEGWGGWWGLRVDPGSRRARFDGMRRTTWAGTWVAMGAARVRPRGRRLRGYSLRQGGPEGAAPPGTETQEGLVWPEVPHCWSWSGHRGSLSRKAPPEHSWRRCRGDLAGGDRGGGTKVLKTRDFQSQSVGMGKAKLWPWEHVLLGGRNCRTNGHLTVDKVMHLSLPHQM